MNAPSPPESNKKNAPGLNSQMLAYRDWLVQTDHKASESYDKAVMALAGGALAISLTFVNYISLKPATVKLLVGAWVCLAVSIVLILVSILTGRYSLQKTIKQVDQGMVYSQIPGGQFSRITEQLNVGALVTFILGVGLLSWFAIANMKTLDNSQEAEMEPLKPMSYEAKDKGGEKKPPPPPPPEERSIPFEEGYTPPPPPPPKDKE